VSKSKNYSDDIWGLSFAVFAVAKMGGVAGIVAWSWWWLLAPFVPLAVELLKRALR
jgi:hypothetical protein